MKIAFIQPTADKFGHYGVYFSKLPQELVDLGNDVTVYTNDFSPETFLEDTPKFKVVKLFSGILKFKHIDEKRNKNPIRYWFRYFLNSLLVTIGGLIWCRRNKVDFIYISDSEFLMASIALWLVSVKVPIVMQVNASNFSFDEYPAGFIKKLYKSFQARVFSLTSRKRLAAFSVLGDWHVPRLRKQLKMPESFCIEVIPDGGGADSKKIDKQVARSHLSIPKDHKLFLFSGIMRTDKGLEYLAPTVRRILEGFVDVTFVIAGQPFEYSEEDLSKLFSVEPELQSRLKLIFQYLPEEMLPYYFSAADCLLLPYSTLYKGSTGPLMKAACTYNLPVIVSNVAAMGEMTRENGLGLVVEPENTDDLFSAIESVIKATPAELRVFADNTEDFGSQNSWSTMAARYEQLFTNL